MSSIRAKIAGFTALILLSASAIALPSSASAATTTDPVQAAAAWLSGQFEDGTHLPALAGDHFDSSFSGSFFANYGAGADAVFGLAAAKAGATKSAAAIAYLATNVDDYADLSSAFGGPFDGSVAKAAVAAQVAGVSGSPATNFGGHNLLTTLKTDECAPVGPATTCPVTGSTPIPAGSPAGIFSSISASFVIIAEARAGGGFAPSANALAYFLSLQCTDGGFTSGTAACGSGASDVDATSYAIMALAAAGGHASALTSAVTWLTSQRNASGYWIVQSVPNANSTGLATAALASQSVNVTTSRTWLLSQQVAAGSAGAGALKYGGAFAATTLAATSPSVTATSQGLTGLATSGSLAVLTAAGSTATTSAFAAAATAGAASGTVGAQFTATAAGFTPGETVTAVLHSAPVTVGTAVAGAGGTASVAFAIPASVDPGSHTIVFTGATSGLTATTAAFTVAAAPVTPAASASTDDLANTGLNGPALRNLAVLGLFALLAGAGLLFGSRRRRSA